MKRALLVGIVITMISILLIIGVIAPGIRWLNHNKLSYIEHVTGIAFPFSVSQIDVFDNMEHYVVAQIRLQDADITPFANEYGFNTAPVAATSLIETLKFENRTIPTNADLLYLEGHSNNNSWLSALDQNSGRLWIVVFYPDPGGVTP